jgi:Icc protein
MNLAWATDIHLNFVEREHAERFCGEIAASGAEALLLGGDIAEADDLENWLRFLDGHLEMPVYFVLGNHDYYGGSIASIHARTRALTGRHLHWLPETGPVPLTERTALVGEGGWGDARHGDFMASPVVLSDYLLIDELRNPDGAPGPPVVMENRARLKEKLHYLGDQAARSLHPHLAQALDEYPEVLLLTHVPPFHESCWYEGGLSNEDWLPGFTCRAIGDLLLAEVGRHPDRRITVLCGHTHGEGVADPLPNLHVITGGAEYGRPAFRTIQVE